MSTVLIIISIIAIVVSFYLCIHFKNKLDDVQIDNAVLKQIKVKLEEQLEDLKNGTPANGTPNASHYSGVEILNAFSRAHQVQIEKHEDYEDEDWELYQFIYQDGKFCCYTHKKTDEVMLRYFYFETLPYSEDMEIRILRMCDSYTSQRKYVKLTYSVDEEKAGEPLIYLHLYFDLIGVTPEILEHIIRTNFHCAREVSDAVDELRKKMQEEPSQNAAPAAKTEADFQEMAIRMAIDKKGKAQEELEN